MGKIYRPTTYTPLLDFTVHEFNHLKKINVKNEVTISRANNTNIIFKKIVKKYCFFL